MQINLQFKTERQEREFKFLTPKTQALALWVNFYLQSRDIITPTITECFRSQVEQDAIYGPGAPRSPHQDGRAFDLRSSDLPEEVIALLVNDTNNAFPRKDAKRTALYHDVGRGKHLHFQVTP